MLSSNYSYIQKLWLDSVKSEWFACMAQKTLSPACVRSYINTISKLSDQLLGIVVNLKDDKVLSDINKCKLKADIHTA